MKSHQTILNHMHMEMAGLEPASRDIATQASTSVFDLLSFADSSANRQASEWLV